MVSVMGIVDDLVANPGLYLGIDHDAKVVMAMPESGRLRHAWWYGSPATNSSSATFRT
jgi:hypothetical protein